MRYFTFPAVIILLTCEIVYAAEANRCERLFHDPAGIATCNTLSGMDGGLSDEELRERVSKLVYGVSADELERELAKQEVEKKRQQAEDEVNLQKNDQCYRLFNDPLERETCRTLRMLTYRNRTDDEMRKDVREYLSSKNIDIEKERKAAIDAELKRKDYDAWVQRSAREEEKRRAEQEKLEKQEAVARARRQKAAAVALDDQLASGAVGFLFRSWEKGGFGNVLIIRFIIQNNTATALKDFDIACNARANSGTLLGSPRATLYERIEPGARRAFSLNMGLIHSQAARVSCGVAKWLPA